MKEGIHLNNLAKQLELYKQNPATGGNGGGMGGDAAAGDRTL